MMLRPARTSIPQILNFQTPILLKLCEDAEDNVVFVSLTMHVDGPRHRSVENTLALAERARGITDRIGLVGASISDHPQIDEIATGLVERGFRISCASLRAETVRAPFTRCTRRQRTRYDYHCPRGRN